ncbi:hypothetical protein NDU88_001927 [Pleurodeles waltl]|uniref:Uncharacterized protein n=1 Tax=Pleurodeles waltl TaxID=8319 RepID=A0AAV7R9X9_PLEWA|nr:hypothetical protein NDU88_001927 [Pleurodeles waltl]
MGSAYTLQQADLYNELYGKQCGAGGVEDSEVPGTSGDLEGVDGESEVELDFEEDELENGELVEGMRLTVGGCLKIYIMGANRRGSIGVFQENSQGFGVSLDGVYPSRGTTGVRRDGFCAGPTLETR